MFDFVLVDDSCSDISSVSHFMNMDLETSLRSTDPDTLLKALEHISSKQDLIELAVLCCILCCT